MVFAPFTPFEQAAISIVQNHQITTSPNSTELLLCLTGDGEAEIDRSVGLADRVELTQAMLRACASGAGCRLIHNHPSQGSLSQSDWNLHLAHPGIAEIVAVNSRGSIFRGAVKDNAGLAKIAPNIDEFTGAIELSMNSLAIYPHPEFDLLDPLRWACSHLLNERLAAKSLISYQVVLASTDIGLLNRDDAKALIDIARTTANRWVP